MDEQTVHSCLSLFTVDATGVKGLILAYFEAFRGVSSFSFFLAYDTIRYEMLFNVRSKADMSQLNLPHRTNN